MTSEEKKAYLLLKSIIFQYHGLDEEEQRILEETAQQLKAEDELKWATEFISQDYYTAFDRARDFFSSQNFKKEQMLHFLDLVWKSNNRKGYITEMEATGMLRFARDWQVERELISLVRG